MIKAIVFDIGGVMVMGDNMRTHYTPLIKSLNLNKENYFNSYRKHVHDASRGKITSKEMISLIAKDLKVNSKKLYSNWIKYKKRSIKKNVKLERFIKQLKNQGYKVGSMSGVLDLHYRLFKTRKIYGVFDFNIYSFKTGYNKPDIGIYKLLLRTLKISPKEIVFIDDVKKCLIPAKKLGMQTILYQNNKQVFRDLKKVLK